MSADTTTTERDTADGLAGRAGGRAAHAGRAPVSLESASPGGSAAGLLARGGLLLPGCAVRPCSPDAWDGTASLGRRRCSWDLHSPPLPPPIRAARPGRAVPATEALWGEPHG